jgi:hypothetical protein
MADLFGFDRYEHIVRSAEISDCGRYRWWLRRSWKHGGDGRVVCFVMLNPSTADALQDDPTIRRCMGFARAWGVSAVSVRNLFAFRETNPKLLGGLRYEDATGGDRGDVELLAAFTADIVVCAWGASGPKRTIERAEWFVQNSEGKPLHCLGMTGRGLPRHPLYVRGDQPLVPF